MPVHEEFSSMETPFFSINAADQFSVTDGAPLHSVVQSRKFSGSSLLSSCNVGNSNIPSIDRLPSLSCFGSESLPEIRDSFVLPQVSQLTSSPCPQELPSAIVHGTEKSLKQNKRKRMPECGIQSNFPTVNHCVEGEQQRDVPVENDEKPQASDVSPHVKENGNGNRENYIHVRAKSGQATNSHSLAERVRREKISERMKLLQDLVPGCNKITGKAVMLDEIINYVQSLQGQVEFLSMKLAAVNPEINLDMEQIFRKESLPARFGSLPTPGCCPQIPVGIGLPSLTNYRGIFRTTINHQISPMVQLSNPWDFQNAIQPGLILNIPHDALDLTGSMKVEF